MWIITIFCRSTSKYLTRKMLKLFSQLDVVNVMFLLCTIKLHRYNVSTTKQDWNYQISTSLVFTSTMTVLVRKPVALCFREWRINSGLNTYIAIHKHKQQMYWLLTREVEQQNITSNPGHILHMTHRQKFSIMSSMHLSNGVTDDRNYSDTSITFNQPTVML